MSDRQSPSGRRRRVRSVWPSMVPLAVVWCLLWGEFSLFNVLAGALVGAVVVIAFPMPPLHLHLRPRPVALAVLVGKFVVDVVVSSVRVAWTALRPGASSLTNAIVRVELATPSDFVLTVVAQMTSLIPGSIVVDVHRARHTLYLHVLDVNSAEEADEFRQRVLEQEERVVAAIGGYAHDIDERSDRPVREGGTER